MALPRLAIAEDLGRLIGLLRRGDRSDVQEARRIAASVRRALNARPSPSAPEPSGEEREQLGMTLRFLDAAALVEDCPIAGLDEHGRPCPMRALTCLSRQLASEMEVGKGAAAKRSSPAKRGRLATFVQCRTELCHIGAAVRARLGDIPEAVEMAKKAPRCTDTAS